MVSFFFIFPKKGDESMQYLYDYQTGEKRRKNEQNGAMSRQIKKSNILC